MVKSVKNYHAPKFEFLTTPRSSIWAKNRMDGYGAKSRWGPPRVHFGPIGSHWGQKMGQNRTKLPCPKIRIFDYCAVINLCKKSNLRLLRQITVGNPWGLSWGQWGAIGTKKWVKTVKNCHAPKFEFLTTPPTVIDLGKKRIYVYGTKSRWGPPRVHLGVNGDQLGPKNQKMGENRKKLPCPKFEFLTTPRSSIWAKHRIYGYDAKSRWGTPEVHPKANGSHWGPKMGQNRKKLPCPKIRIFDYSAVIDLGKKSNLWLWH